jgi:hypothetical protein
MELATEGESEGTLVFNYGSNSTAQLRGRLLNSALKTTAARLPGFERVFCLCSEGWGGGGVATLMPSDEQGSIVYGSVCCLNPQELALLDTFVSIHCRHSTHPFDHFSLSIFDIHSLSSTGEILPSRDGHSACGSWGGKSRESHRLHRWIFEGPDRPRVHGTLSGEAIGGVSHCNRWLFERTLGLEAYASVRLRFGPPQSTETVGRMDTPGAKTVDVASLLRGGVAG